MFRNWTSFSTLTTAVELERLHGPGVGSSLVGGDCFSDVHILLHGSRLNLKIHLCCNKTVSTQITKPRARLAHSLHPPLQSEGKAMRVVVEGCCHGELDNIYAVSAPK